MNRRRLTTVALALAVVGAIALLAPEIISGTFSDLDTFVRVALLAVGLGLWVWLARRLVPDARVGAVVAAVPVVVVLWLLLWPYLRPATEVDEAFPPVVATTPTTTPTPTPTTTDAPTTAPPGSTESTAATPSTTAPTTTVPVPTEPVELARDGFQGLAGHRGSGDAALYRLADGSILLRFEEVDIGSGPDLEVYVVPGEDKRGLGGGHHVASLTAERGNQNYTPPAAVDLTTGTWTVLVWCETFAVEIANATLTV